MGRSKYKRLPDLYTTGKVVVLKNGDTMWLQVPNPFERDEATHDGQVARARLVLALKDHGSDELLKVRGAVAMEGRKTASEKLIATQQAGLYVKVVTALQNDPDWAERLEIRERGEDLLARPAEDPERQLMEQIDSDYLDEVTKRVDAEVEFLKEKYANATLEVIESEYLDLYVERRGADVALAEMTLTELWYAARCCDAQEDADQVDGWDHSLCDHSVQAFETKAEVRALPDDLQDLLARTLGELQMTARDARFSDRQGSSSDSSPLPSEPAESTASTSTETPASPPGSSE